MPVSITITVADLPPMPDGAELYCVYGGHYRRDNLNDAVAAWIKLGTDCSDLVAHCHFKDGDGQFEYECEWTGEKWTEWKV